MKHLLVVCWPACSEVLEQVGQGSVAWRGMEGGEEELREGVGGGGHY